MIAKLEMLLALAKEEHFGKAAQSIGVTQPTLSTGIRQLEEQLGVKLVRRGSRYGGLTPEGQRALVWARQIVGDSRRLRDEMRASHAGLAGHVRLAVIPTALTWAAHLSARFGRLHPNISFSILSRSSTDILSMLENLDADAGLTYLDNEPLGRMSMVEMYKERYTFVCAPDHPLAGNTQISWQDLNNQRLCLLTPDMQNRRIINRLFMDAGVKPATMFESSSTIVLIAAVLEGGFTTILPVDMARFLTEGKDVAMVPIASQLAAPAVGLIAPHQEPQTPVLGAMIRVAEQLSANI